MTKFFTLLVVALALSLPTNAQPEFHWGAGLSMVKVDQPWAPGICIAPRLNLAELSVSAGFAIGADPSFMVGYAGETNQRPSELRTGFDLPIYAMFNVGRAATYYSTEQVGVFAGVGYDYSSMTAKPKEGESIKYVSKGPMVIGGVKFPVAGKYTMGANVSKTFAKGDDGLDGLAVRVLWYFGDY